MAASSPPSGPLQGIRVLDFGTYIAGSFAALLMGDLGADVIKVEPPSGDPAREVGPFLNGEGRFFVSLNRNKRGVALDLTRPEGQGLAHRLVEDADIVTSNFRPGIATRLQLDYETLRQINPSLIYCAASGFGSKGPIHQRPAFDGILQAMAGIAQANALVSGTVAQSAVLMVDFTTALLSLGATLAALHHRQQTGEGQKVETSLLQASMILLPYYFSHAIDTDDEGPGGGFPYRVFATRDGHLFVGSAQNKFWPLLCEALGIPELGNDLCLRTNRNRVERAAEINPKLEERFRTRTTAEWETILAAIGVPCGPVLAPGELLGHPQVEAMDMASVVEHATIGDMKVFGPPFHLERTPARIQRLAPTLGQHTDEVLQQAGVEPEEIERLRAEKIVF